MNPVSPGPENNVDGDIPAAQTVASHWPTKIAWDGAEIGDSTPAGGSIDSTQPPDSPVRVSYDAYNVGRGASVGSPIAAYDLTAVYHAIRPNDPLLAEVGPGAQAITSQGNNVFTVGGTNAFGVSNQYYLTLTNPLALSASIDELLDAPVAHHHGHHHGHDESAHDSRARHGKAPHR
jgi:hypothetical protein